MWIEQNEGAKFWLNVMNEFKNRGVEDILLAVVDGLKGFPDAINAAFPDTVVQTPAFAGAGSSSASASSKPWRRKC
jgi:putative transposase